MNFEKERTKAETGNKIVGKANLLLFLMHRKGKILQPEKEQGRTHSRTNFQGTKKA